MKGIILFTTMLFLATGASSAWTNDSGELVCRNSSVTKNYGLKGGSDVWPWGNELTFPWTGIDGIWQTVGTDCGNLYSFSISENSTTGAKIVHINEYDPVACRVVSAGRGFESRRVVRAVMAGAKGAYQLTIHAFRASEVRAYDVSSSRQVLVLRVRPLNSNGRLTNKSFAYRLEKIGNSTSMMCKN